MANEVWHLTFWSVHYSPQHAVSGEGDLPWLSRRVVHVQLVRELRWALAVELHVEMKPRHVNESLCTCGHIQQIEHNGYSFSYVSSSYLLRGVFLSFCFTIFRLVLFRSVFCPLPKPSFNP